MANGGLTAFFAEGGAAMYLVLLVGLLGLLAPIVQLALLRAVDLGPLLVGLVALTLICGLLGSALGISQAFGATAYAAPEQKAALLAQGVSIALNNTVLALILVLLQTLLAAVAATVRRNLAPR